ncbi:unnamed protein product [Mucor hiemalis]
MDNNICDNLLQYGIDILPLTKNGFATSLSAKRKPKSLLLLSVHANLQLLMRTLKVENSTAIFDDDSSILREIRVQIEANPQPQMKSMCIDPYFNSPGHKFLSISPSGQYITLSTHDEKKGDEDGSCFIFKVQENEISFCHEIKCNGRAVFLNNGLRLAILNTATLIVYDEVKDFSKKLTYEVYDLTPFGTMNEDFQNSRFQFSYTDFVDNWAVSKNPQSDFMSYEPKMRHIIALSAYIKSNLLITPFTEKSETIRFWSLINNGMRLASLTASGDAVIAISKDFKYAATANSNVKVDNVVKVYNLDNECLVYTLKSQISILKLSHATFCYDSRYLALSAVERKYDVNNPLVGKNVAIFEVWYIEGERSVYSTVKSLGLILPGTLNRTQVKSLKPFISEEIVDNDRRIL